MNLANKTVVKSIPKESHEYSMVRNLCDYGTNMRAIADDDNDTDTNTNTEVNDTQASDKWETFRNLIIKVRKFRDLVNRNVC